MNVEVELVKGSWIRAVNAARFTQHKAAVTKEPSYEWKRKALIAQHSPIRLVEYIVTFREASYAAIMHLVRHHIGIEKFVATSRPDITGEPVSRHEQRKDDPTDAMFVINAQAMINISKLRLCQKAEKETRILWNMVVEKVRECDPALYRSLAASCVERSGHCPEMKPCGFCNTEFREHLTNEYYKTTKE